MDPGLLQSVLDSPDDDFPRLVLADWLEEQGDEERAEFIRTQVELTKVPKSVIDEASIFNSTSVPMLRAVRLRTPKFDEDVSSHIGLSMPPEFLCDVSDQELMMLEDYTSSGGRVGRLVRLPGRDVRILLNVGEEDRRFVLRVGRVLDAQERTEKSTRYCRIVPQAMLVGDRYVWWREYTLEAAKYDALRQRERGLLTPDNARAWTEGPWWSDKLVATFRNSDPVMSGRQQLEYWNNEVFKFRFHRGFVEEAWFREDVFYQHSQELRKSHPVKTVNRMPSRPEGIWTSAGGAMSGSPIGIFADVQRYYEASLAIPADVLRGELGMTTPSPVVDVSRELIRRQYSIVPHLGARTPISVTPEGFAQPARPGEFVVGYADIPPIPDTIPPAAEPEEDDDD